MASKDPEEHFNSDTDEETVALRKKRLRRVSFADREITSVHIFNRDDDNETPPDDPCRKPSSDEDEREVLGFFRDLAADSDDFKDMSSADKDEVVSTKSFFRPIESPSPGSSVIGSATSTDENFFGPVSASFIRHGRLSDSAASDDNHDITMDSTAFSMHFRSLVRSESGDLKTPSGTNFSIEEKTPTQVSTSSDPGSFMVLTKAKKPIVQIPLAVDKVSGGRDSNDMSLVGDDPHRYDYARLSPALEALLAESGKNTQVDPLFDSASDTKSLKKSEVPIFNDIGSGILDTKDNRDFDMCNVGPDGVYAEGVPIAHTSLGEVNGGSMATLIGQITHDCPSSRIDDVVADVHGSDHIQGPNQLNNVKDTSIEVITGMSMPNIEIPVGGCDNPPDVNGNSVRRWGLHSQHEPADLYSPKNLLKGNLSADGTRNSHIAQLPDQHPGSPLSGSVTLLSAKRKHIFLDTTNSSRHLPHVTPSPKHSGSFLRNENIKVGENMSSTRKSHSKFQISGSSARTAALRDELEKSKRRLSEYLTSATSPVNNVMEETARNLQFQHVDASVVDLEKHFFSADRKNEEHAITADMNGDGRGIPKNFGSLNQNKISLLKGGESLDQLSNLIPSEDKQTEMIAAAAAYPAQLTSPGKIQHLLMSNNPTQGSLGVSISDTSSVEITLDHRKDQKATNDFDIFISPPMKSLDQKLSSLAEIQGSLSGKLRQEVQCKSPVIDSRLDGNSIEYATSGKHLTGMADKLDSLSVEERKVSNSPLTGINHVTVSTQEKRVDDRDIYTSALQKASEMVKKFQILSGDMDLMKFQLSTPDKNLQIAIDPSLPEEELPGEEIKASPCASASPYVQRTVNEPSVLKSPIRKDPTWSPCRKEQGDSSLSNGKHFSRIGLSSKSNSDEHANDDFRQGIDNSLNPSAVQDFDNSSRGKRRSEEIDLGDADNFYNTNWTQRLKVHKSGGTDLELMMEQTDGNKKGNEKIGGDTTLKHWTDISLKFSAQTNQILSPSIEKLNTGAIGILEDILACMQKVYKYEMLCSEILSQKIYDRSSNVGHNRVAETGLLLYKIVYEKAMLQIARLKHERLLKKGRLLDSGIQKFETLKLNYVRHLSAPVKRDTQVDDNLHDSSSVNVGSKHEVASDNVTGMRWEVESLDRKTKNLIKSFHTYCKIKEELSCADTITLLNDNLKKRICCRTIRQDFQLWEIDDLEMNSNHSLVLNYSGFICQRFTRIANPVSSTIISNKINDLKIMKNFPNIDARVAFAFVFNAESTKKSIGSKSLAQETQTTSSLLHNLLAVVEEVRLARIENRNLIHASFNSPSAEQLDLQLRFIDFNSGRKVTMTLDVTCLNRGVYPSEILPYQLEVFAARMQKSLPEVLSTEIKTTISNLAAGYPRVITLCRCVSQVVQLSSRSADCFTSRNPGKADLT